MQALELDGLDGRGRGRVERAPDLVGCHQEGAGLAREGDGSRGMLLLLVVVVLLQGVAAKPGASLLPLALGAPGMIG